MKNDMPTWLSILFGGTLTLIATFVAHFLSEKTQKKKEVSLIDGFLQGIHDEIETLWDTYWNGAGTIIENLNDKEPLLIYYPSNQEYFTIYNNNAFLIGRIKDHHLRKEIVSTYIKAHALLDSLHMNNDLMRKFENAFLLFQETSNEVYKVRAEAYRGSLIVYAEQLKKSHYVLKDKVTFLLGSLNKKRDTSSAYPR